MDIILLRPPVAPFLYSIFQIMSQCGCQHLIVMAAPHHSLVPLHYSGQVFDVVEYDDMLDWATALHRAMTLVLSDRVIILDPNLNFDALDFDQFSHDTSEVSWVPVDLPVDTELPSIRKISPRFSGYMMMLQDRRILPSLQCLMLSRAIWERGGGIDTVFCDLRIATLEWMDRCDQAGIGVAPFQFGYCASHPTFLWDLSSSPSLEAHLALVDQYLLTWRRMTILRFFCFHFLGITMMVLSFKIRHFRAIMKAALRMIRLKVSEFYSKKG